LQRNLPDMPQPADFGAFLYNLTRPSQHDMPMVAQTLCELPTLANGLEAESYQNPPDLENRFLHRWMRYTVWTVALRWAIFKRKKGIIYPINCLISTIIS
jgi:hypothetical protein